MGGAPTENLNSRDDGRGEKEELGRCGFDEGGDGEIVGPAANLILAEEVGESSLIGFKVVPRGEGYPGKKSLGIDPIDDGGKEAGGIGARGEVGDETSEGWQVGGGEVESKPSKGPVKNSLGEESACAEKDEGKSETRFGDKHPSEDGQADDGRRHQDR